MQHNDRHLLLVCAVMATWFSSTGAVACGDSLYRVGKGVAYRVYSAPLPGNVLIYGSTDDAQALSDSLAESGHSVRWVKSPIELQVEMSTGHYDVVIAPYHDHATIEASDSRTEYLPVASSRQEALEASARYDDVLELDRDELKHYLKAIHKSLKRQAST